MGLDDKNEGHGAGECVEHLWRLAAVSFDRGGTVTEYGCERCSGSLLVPPGGVHPETV